MCYNSNLMNRSKSQLLACGHTNSLSCWMREVEDLDFLEFQDPEQLYVGNRYLLSKWQRCRHRQRSFDLDRPVDKPLLIWYSNTK
jgi:hypothetical protein